MGSAYGDRPIVIRNTTQGDVEFVLSTDLSLDDPSEVNFSMSRVCVAGVDLATGKHLPRMCRLI